MRVTRYLIGIFVVLFTFSTVIAQEQGEGSRRERPARGERRGFNPEQMIQAYKERLNLTDKQVDQLKEIFKESREKMIALREDDSMDRRQRMEAMMKMREDQNEEIKKMLTEEQLKTYEAYLKERQERRGRRNPPGEGERRGRDS